MRERVRAVVAAATWVVVPVAAIVALHRLGAVDWLRVDPGDIGGWLRRSTLEEALAASLRYAGLVAGYWLAISTALYLSTRLAGLHGPARLLRAVTLPAVRHVVERLAVGSLAVSTLTGPLAAVAEPTVPPTVTVSDGYTPAPYLDLAQPPPEESIGPPARVGPAPEGAFPVPDGAVHIRLDASLEVIVRPGDHLWSLAERRLSEALGRTAGDHEVAPYWLRVIDANRPRLRSGNPDLIFPGEVIVLPALD